MEPAADADLWGALTSARSLSLAGLIALALLLTWLALRVMAFEAAYFRPDADRASAGLPDWMRPLPRAAAAALLAILSLWLAAGAVALRAAQLALTPADGLPPALGGVLMWAAPLAVGLLGVMALRSASAAQQRPGSSLSFGGAVLRLLSPLLVLPAVALSRTYTRLTEAPTADQRAAEIEGLEQTIDATPEVDSPVEEKALLKSLITLNRVPVRSVMCPRAQMRILTTALTFTEVLRQVREQGYSRYPVTDASGRTVRGILVAKDLLPLLGQAKAEADWRRLLRTPYFVAETKRVPQLLSEFKQRRIHLAIVLNEAGELAGLVTLQDILEEIFGELKDEFDTPGPARPQPSA